jgi:hypothetical protein
MARGAAGGATCRPSSLACTEHIATISSGMYVDGTWCSTCLLTSAAAEVQLAAREVGIRGRGWVRLQRVMPVLERGVDPLTRR